MDSGARSPPPRSARRWCVQDTSVSAPPITPPKATARSASAITHMPGSKRVRLVIDGLEQLAGPRLADDDLRPGQLGEIERVQRLTAFHHHIVGDVHDVVDRPRSRSSPADPPATAGSARPARRGARGPCSGEHSCGHSMATLVSPSPAGRPLRAGASGTQRPVCQRTETSRATPMCPRQSGRLLVTSRSICQVVPDGLAVLVVQPGHRQPLEQARRRHRQGRHNPGAISRKQHDAPERRQTFKTLTV